MAKKSTKKATTRKTTAKKTTAKKATPKRAYTKKANPTTSEQPGTDFPDFGLTDVLANTRRPPNNPEVPKLVIDYLTIEQHKIRGILDEYAQHLRSLDRRRLNGVGIKHQGFIDRTLELAAENPEFLPHYLTLKKFQDDDQYYVSFRAMYDVAKQIQELIWNITIIASDIVYTDALEYYASVREAAKRRVDAAEAIFNSLETFFKRRRATGPDGQPIVTEKEEIHDAIAYIHGKKDGKFLAENISPKVEAGVHKIIDEKFTNSASFQEKADGELKE